MKTIARHKRTIQHRFPEVKDIIVLTEGFRTTIILKLPEKKRAAFETGGIGPSVNSAVFDKAERWLYKEFRQWNGN